VANTKVIAKALGLFFAFFFFHLNLPMSYAVDKFRSRSTLSKASDNYFNRYKQL